MTELFRTLEPQRTCSYLPAEVASLEYRGVLEMSAERYADLLARGYRRFGWQVFRPACPACAQCRSIRVLARQFQPNASERRVLRKNAHIRAELRPLFVTADHIDLFNRYHRYMHLNREWPTQATDPRAYSHDFLSGASAHGRQWLYYDRERLVGVALMDEVPNAVSLVYFFYDPDWRAKSPGIFSVLNQILYAQQRGYDYAYLGYWVQACPSMNYKGRFHPREILEAYPIEGNSAIWSAAF
jgi:arginyl-tRNA--protein-N-Asp/Glu arginylyltransferase